MSFPYPNLTRFSRSLLIALLAISGIPGAKIFAAQVSSGGSRPNTAKLPQTTKEASSPKAEAYYHFSLGHLYEELAATYGNRSDYVNKAIENYRLAMKEDPNAGFLVEDIAELYRVSGRIREAVEEAQNALKANPNDLNARRVLARIYTQQIGDAQTNHIDEGMARRAVEQYKFVTDKDPKDTDSLIMLGRLERLLNNSVDAESAFKKVLVSDPSNEDAAVGLAGIYSDRGDPRSASAILEKIEKNGSPRIFILLAANYEQMHEYALAADAYQKALAQDPGRIEIKEALAQDQALAGRLDDALKTYQEIADANPQSSQGYLGMSQIYRQQRNFEMARKMNEKAKQVDPDNLDVRYNEVLTLEAEGKNADAIASLKSILDSTSRRVYSPSDRGARIKMLDKLGSLYQANEQYDQAADAFRQIGQLNPDLESRAEAEIIDTYRMGKSYSKAQQASDAALKKFPNDRTLREVHSQLLADEGKPDLAIAELKKLLDGKDDRQIYLAMAQVYEKAHNYSEMGKALDSAEKLSQDKGDKVTVIFMRGSMYEREKQYDLAEKDFRQVIDLDPKNASAMNYLGYMLADRNIRLDEAKNLIKQAVDLEPNNYAFLDSLGWVYYRLNRLTDAEQQLERSVQLMSKDPTIHDHLGDVYFKQGKIRQAITQWESSLKEWNQNAPSDAEPDEIAKVQKKLDSARMRLAKERTPTTVNER